MFWGLFLILFGGLTLLDRWFVRDLDFFPALIIAGLIAWGGSILFDRGGSGSVERCCSQTQENEQVVGEAKIESTTASSGPIH